MRNFIGLLLVCSLFTAEGRGVDLCQQIVELAARYPDCFELGLLAANSTYLPKYDRAGYTPDGTLMALERAELTYDPRMEQHLITNVLAFPHGSADPSTWRQTLPSLAGPLRERGMKDVFSLGPAFLTATQDGTGAMEAWDYSDRHAPRRVLVNYELKTFPEHWVRANRYQNIRRIQYAEPVRVDFSFRGDVEFRREVFATQIEYYAPGAGLIQRRWIQRFRDTKTQSGETTLDNTHVSAIDYEPIWPGSQNSGIFAEHLSTIALGRTKEDFVTLVEEKLGSGPFSPAQADAVQLVYQTGRAFDLKRFDAAMSPKEGFLVHLRSQGLSDHEIEVTIATAREFFYR